MRKRPCDVNCRQLWLSTVFFAACLGGKLDDDLGADSATVEVSLPVEGEYSFAGEQYGGDMICLGYGEAEAETHHSWSEDVRLDVDVLNAGPVAVRDVTDEGFLLVLPNYLLPSEGVVREIPCSFHGFVEGTAERQYVCEPYYLDFEVGDGVISIASYAGGRFTDPCSLRLDPSHVVSCRGEALCDDWVAECSGSVEPDEIDPWPGNAFLWLYLECVE